MIKINYLNSSNKNLGNNVIFIDSNTEYKKLNHKYSFSKKLILNDVKSKKMMDSLSIDCNTVDRYLKSNSWVQIDAYNKSEFKWYFNKDFLNDLKTTLGCK